MTSLLVQPHLQKSVVHFPEHLSDSIHLDAVGILQLLNTTLRTRLSPQP